MQIINSLTVSLEAGMVVTCQLGNPTDAYWYPAAPVLLLYTDVCFSGVQFTGLYKDPDGSWHIARFVESHRTRDYYVNRTGLDVGIAYCTYSLHFDKETQECEYASKEANALFAQGLRYHCQKVAELPAAAKYIRLELQK